MLGLPAGAGCPAAWIAASGASSRAVVKAITVYRVVLFIVWRFSFSRGSATV